MTGEETLHGRSDAPGDPRDGETGPGRPEEEARSAAIEEVYLPAEVSRFLAELSRAMQKHTMYPPAHPALRPAVARVRSALEPLLEDRAERVLGIGKRRIAAGEAETNPQHPVFGALAAQLHAHELASIAFHAGIGENELAEFLARVSADPKRSGQPLGETLASEGQPWRHVVLEPVRYDALRLAWERGAPSSEEAAEEVDRLWLTLARAFLPPAGARGAADGDREGDAGPGAPAPEAGATPAELAKALGERSSDEAYAREAFQGLAAVSRELRSATAGPARELQRRTSEVVSIADLDALGRVLGAGSVEERHGLLRHAARWMDPPAVVKLARATGGAEGRAPSNTLLLLMAKMARYATSEGPDVRTEAAAGLQSQVDRLVAGWEREGSVPAPYREALERMTFSEAERTDLRTSTPGVDPGHALRIGLLAEKVGPHVWNAVTALMQARRFSDLLDGLDSAAPGSVAAEELWEDLAHPRAVRWILEEEPPDFGILDRFVSRVGARAAPSMLDVLVETESRETRNALFSRLTGMGPAIAPHLLERLDDRRWRVRRDMLALLGQVSGWPARWSPHPYSKDAHPAVRAEALKLLLRDRSQRDRAICELLAEEEPRARALGLAAAQRETPPEATSLLLAILEDEAAETRLRILALRALDRLRPPELPGPLLELVAERRGGLMRLLGPWRPLKLRRKTPLVLEALSALARGWSDAPGAEAVLARARRSDDEEVRGAAAGQVGP